MLLVPDYLADKPYTSPIANVVAVVKLFQKPFHARHFRPRSDVVVFSTIPGPTDVALVR